MKESTCVYLIHEGKWLMLFRNRKAHDVNAGKYIGVGGKREPGESMLECAMREVREETGLSMIHPDYRGTVFFSYSGSEEERIAVYTCTDWTGTMHDDNEGTLCWVGEDKILDLNLWQGDRYFLKKLLHHDKEPFCFHLYYDEKGNLLRSEEREDTVQ